jgi:hypothetical protein
MRELLTNVREGMPVYDSTNEKIGTVRDVYLGSEAGASSEPPPPSPHSFIDHLAQALASTALPDVVRQRLRRKGFIRVDVSGPVAADRYAFASQIRGVSEEGVTLHVRRDDLLWR